MTGNVLIGVVADFPDGEIWPASQRQTYRHATRVMLKTFAIKVIEESVHVEF
jgi:hypothetical protein